MVERISTVLSGTESVELQTGESGDPAAGRGLSRKERVKPEELENAYLTVPTIFNSINTTTQFIMSNEWSLSGDNVSLFEDFLSGIGDVGGEQHWDELLETIFRYQSIYGECFVELIRDRNSGEVVDLAFIDPKTMDYAEDGQGTVALDEFGNPKGYVQDLSELQEMSRDDPFEQPFEVPDDVSLEGGDIFIPSENVAHFKMYTVGEGFRPVGLIEPVYQSAERSFQLKQDYADKAHTTLFPLRVASVGDENHEPTPEKIHKMLRELSKADSATEVALPHYVDLDMLEAENPEALIDFFRQFDDDMIAGMGQVKAFVRGSGEDVNRATLNSQSLMFQISMHDIIKRTARTIEREIFEEYADSRDLDGFPSMDWDLDAKKLQNLQTQMSDDLGDLKPVPVGEGDERIVGEVDL